MTSNREVMNTRTVAFCWENRSLLAKGVEADLISTILSPTQQACAFGPRQQQRSIMSTDLVFSWTLRDASELRMCCGLICCGCGCGWEVVGSR